MEMQLKQRLIGAGVLMALGVIFIPILLAPKSDEVENNIVPPIEVEQFTSKVLPIDDAVVDSLSAELDSDPPLATIETNVTDESEPVASDEWEAEDQARVQNNDGVSPPRDITVSSVASSAQPSEETPSQVGAWVVQVASFAKKENAVALVEKLTAADFAAYMETVEGGPASHRVRVGPDLDKLAAEKTQRKIHKQFQLEGIIRRQR